MSYEISVQDDLPLLRITLGATILSGEIETLTVKVSHLLDGLAEPVYNLVDASATHVDLGIILDGVKASVHGKSPALLHPNIIETVVVTTDALIITAIRGLNTPTFSNVNIRLFDTLDEALGYVRTHSRPAVV